jgi:hypothetical protein
VLLDARSGKTMINQLCKIFSYFVPEAPEALTYLSIKKMNLSRVHVKFHVSLSSELDDTQQTHLLLLLSDQTYAKTLSVPYLMQRGKIGTSSTN